MASVFVSSHSVSFHSAYAVVGMGGIVYSCFMGIKALYVTNFFLGSFLVLLLSGLRKLVKWYENCLSLLFLFAFPHKSFHTETPTCSTALHHIAKPQALWQLYTLFVNDLHEVIPLHYPESCSVLSSVPSLAVDFFVCMRLRFGFKVGWAYGERWHLSKRMGSFFTATWSTTMNTTTNSSSCCHPNSCTASFLSTTKVLTTGLFLNISANLTPRELLPILFSLLNSPCLPGVFSNGSPLLSKLWLSSTSQPLIHYPHILSTTCCHV